jgi:hypothetical protein
MAKQKPMTKTEQKILHAVMQANGHGALCGMGNERKTFVDRLIARGSIVYMAWTPQHGAGYATKENVHLFTTPANPKG